MNNYCPVQASINRYCAEMDDSDAFDNAVDDRKQALLKKISPEIVAEALCEVPYTDALWRDLVQCVSQMQDIYDVQLKPALSAISGIGDAVDSYLEKEAERQIKHEWDNPPPSQEDYDDDYR